MRDGEAGVTGGEIIDRFRSAAHLVVGEVDALAEIGDGGEDLLGSEEKDFGVERAQRFGVAVAPIAVGDECGEVSAGGDALGAGRVEFWGQPNGNGRNGR